LSEELVLHDGAFFGRLEIVDLALPPMAQVGYQALRGLKSLKRVRSGNNISQKSAGRHADRRG
jgi:hypothetical protein